MGLPDNSLSGKEILTEKALTESVLTQKALTENVLTERVITEPNSNLTLGEIIRGVCMQTGKEEKSLECDSDRVLERFVRKELFSKEQCMGVKDNANKYAAWIFEGMTHTHKGGITLLVDKVAHQMDVYTPQGKIKSYPIELGSNPYEDKLVKGDRRTPEGIYSISAALPNHHKFHKALYINYPNKQNKDRFKQLKAEGQISDSHSMGGAIEIHGNGSGRGLEGKDWTAGCIALSNEHIDELFGIIHPEEKKPLIKVVIVGYSSLPELKQYGCIIK